MGLKIKCPLAFCNKPDEDFIQTTLYRHIMDDHSDIVTTSYLVHKLFKIQEKIDKYDDGIRFHIFPQHTTSEVLVAELKSLLESEK